MTRNLGRDISDLEKLYARNIELIFRSLRKAMCTMRKMLDGHDGERKQEE